MRDCHWWRCLLPTTTLQKPPNQSLLLHQDDAVRSNCTSFAGIARMLTSWLNRRRQRYLLLVLFSPFLVPLFFAIFPLLCAIEVCRLLMRRKAAAEAEAEGGDERIESPDGGGEVGLLQRYLEDQLILVIETTAYGCDEDGGGGEKVGEECGVDVQYWGSAEASSAIDDI